MKSTIHCSLFILHCPLSIARSIIDRTLASPLGEAGYKVAEVIIDAGFECYWVGGAVRDMALGHLPKEIDMAVSGKPADIATLFKKVDDSASELGTLVVSLAGHTFEITTYREESDVSDGRKPEAVVFSTKEKDAKRRDATMNAIYWNPISREVYDPFDGLTDCREKLVRFIGDPEERIKHDALRSLRLVRLRASISGQYDPETYRALRKTAEKTKVLSGMRILQELDKILTCPHPEVAYEDLFELGILDNILPELAECKGVAQPAQFHAEGDVWNHLMTCVRKFTEDHDSDVRLAVLFHDIGKVQTFSVKERIRFDHHAEVSADLAEKILKRLQAPSERTKKIAWLIRHHMMMGSFKTLSDDRKAHWYFHPWFRELLELFYLDAVGTEPNDLGLYDTIIADYNEFLNTHPRPERPLLSGDDIMELLHLEPSKELGDIMQKLYQAQVRKEITSKEEAKEFLRSLKR